MFALAAIIGAALWASGTSTGVAQTAGQWFVRPSQDFDTLSNAGNTDPHGIWSDGTTMWVVDDADNKFYAYNLSTKQRDSAKDFTPAVSSGQFVAEGIWSDGKGTMWTALDANAKLVEATNMQTSQRDTDKILQTIQANGNSDPRGIWSDGTTMWVADDQDNRIYAYNLATGTPDSEKTFPTHTLVNAFNSNPTGIWSDGTTLWVADSSDDKIYAYNLARKEYDPGKDINLLSAAGNNAPYGLWSDGSTMWVADQDDDKIYAYYYGERCEEDLGALSRAATTKSGAWGADCFGDSETQPGSYAQWYTFTLAERRSMHIDLTSTETTRIEVGDPDNPQTETVPKFAPVAYLRAGKSTSGAYLAQSESSAASDVYHTLEPGTYTVEATNLNPGETGRFTLKINTRTLTDAPAPTTRIVLHADNYTPQGVWSDGTTVWVADSGQDQIYAYNLSTGQHDSGKSFTTLDAANTDPYGLWSDGTTLYVSDASGGKIYAYNLRSKAYNSGRDFNTLATGNTTPYGLWSDGTTLFVVDLSDKIFAYDLRTKQPDSSGNFDTLTGSGALGLWSDGTTMWVSDFTDDKVYGYSLATKLRNHNLELNVGANPAGIWSDGNTMWVVDSFSRDVRAYGDPFSCHTLTLTAAGTTEGVWGPGPRGSNWPCRSLDSPGAGYARYYDFFLSRKGSVTITLSSDHATPRVFLREGGNNRGGSYHNWIGEWSNGASRIQATLDAGVYTIEAVANERGRGGKFSLNLSGSGITASPPEVVLPAWVGCNSTPNLALTPGRTVNGQWGPGCARSVDGWPFPTRGTGPDSVRSEPRTTIYKRDYTFSLPESGGWKRVTITLTNNDNFAPRLKLREEGQSTDNSRYIALGEESGSKATKIEIDLAPGDYVVEALNDIYPDPLLAPTGRFTIGYRVANSRVDCGRTIDPTGEVEDHWFTACAASVGYGYSRFYTFTVPGGPNDPPKLQKISVSTSSPPSLYPALWLRSGADDRTGAYLAQANGLRHSTTPTGSVPDPDGATIPIGQGRNLMVHGQVVRLPIVTHRLSRRANIATLETVETEVEVDRRDSFRGRVYTSKETTRTEGVYLSPGTYTVEVATGADATGRFRLSLSQEDAPDGASPLSLTALHPLPDFSTAGNRQGPTPPPTKAGGADGASGDSGSQTEPTISVLREYQVSVGSCFTLRLPAAVEGTGDGGPYDYSLYVVNGGNRRVERTADVLGFSFDPETRTLIAAPVVPLGMTFRYVVHDGDNDRSDSDAFISTALTLNIVPATGPSVPCAGGEPVGDGGSPNGPSTPDTAPTVSDTLKFKTHYATVGESFSLVLPAADAGSGNGGPYDYLLWHKGAGKKFNDGAINGLSFNPVTRTLSGSPEAEGTWELSYVVHDGDANRNAAADAFRERTNLKIVVLPDNGGAVGDGGPQGDSNGLPNKEEKTITVVEPDTPANRAPSFAADVETTLELLENSPAGTSVGSAFTASDPDDDTLTYSLTGTDAASFVIDSATGQISTAAGASFDYETKQSYTLSVDASDPDGLFDRVAVTVNVANVSPTAAAGTDFDAKRGEEVKLKGKGTADAQGSQTLTYLWTISDASDDELVTVGKKPEFLTNADQAEATFTVMKKKHMTNKSALNDGAWIEFTLTVKDGDNESHSDTVKLTIQGTTWKVTKQ